MSALLRVTYATWSELRDDAQQMEHGGLLVKVHDATGLDFDTPVALELVLPDGSVLEATDAKVLQVLAGHGVAVAFGPALLAAARSRTGVDGPDARPATHERLPPGAPRPARSHTGAPRPASSSHSPATAKPDAAKAEPSTAEKIQLALHGNRDQRMAILRDPNRMLHPYVLKNPQTNADDVLSIAKNAQMSPDLLKQIAQRHEWFQRPEVALALARNPKTPANIAIQALDHCPQEALRQMSKGVGAPPHVIQAARKKILR